MQVLIDGFNTSRPEGTGLASYARSVARSLRRQGHSIALLTDAGLSRRSRLPSAVSLWDHPSSPRRPPAPPLWVRNPLFSARTFIDRFGISSPAGSDVVELDQSSVVDLSLILERVGALDCAINIPNVYRRAFRHFERTGRLLTVRPSRQIDVALFTWCIPIHVEGARNIYTFCDVIPLKLPHLTLDDKETYFGLLKACAARADAIATISETSRDDIVASLGVGREKVQNTYVPCEIEDERLRQPSEQSAARLASALGLKPRSYFLMLGTIETRKNVARTIEAFLTSGIDRELVICGPKNAFTEGELRLLKSLPEARVRVLEYLPRELVLDLVQNASALLMTSYAEGFGLPALEALALGTPVIASDIGALREVCGEAATFVDPYDRASIASAIAALSQWTEEQFDAAAERGMRQARKFAPSAYDASLGKLLGG